MPKSQPNQSLPKNVIATKDQLAITTTAKKQRAAQQSSLQPPPSRKRCRIDNNEDDDEDFEDFEDNEGDKDDPAGDLYELKVALDLHNGRLWRHSGKSKNTSLEQLMTNEIAARFENPIQTTISPLFYEEYTSCERWAQAEQKTHLLEQFTFESTKAPHHLRKKTDGPKHQSPAAIQQAERRTKLAKTLNDLITPFLRNGYQGKGDAHPKCANLPEALRKKDFQGGKNYTVVKVKPTKADLPQDEDAKSHQSISDTASTPLYLTEAEIIRELTAHTEEGSPCP
ncbi:uncharacterized protein MELLADRAFT_112590 [Melampsora larici-populina 98AG31]|uniref:Uncharacterized protein n=1 Tax=Melampsora larici-populina (strain 98AG31 / pathotype 3-4-7) TaxID=747676 RepID=F4S6Z2_MELLP|nr:uncharacterized protein MELLADRAFT_112590 [Melampsora larici-populina 98AG31]EGF99597.1 hypothetical protein MELLADRAFT_112590 [Melampsora larici-populina 98AG31]